MTFRAQPFLMEPAMFDTVLVANRGEIALRIFKSAQQMGFATVAVYSDADRDAQHRFAADMALPIGASAPQASYLNSAALIAAARQSGAQAIHPGYGFLAENAPFAQAVVDAGLVFIGPASAAIAAMGNKAGAKALMQQAGVPCIPGYQSPAAAKHSEGDAVADCPDNAQDNAQDNGQDKGQDDSSFISAANRIGYPVMIKAASGGGGRGMRRVDSAEQMLAALHSARSEAQNSFGNAELILEKAVLNARHIEIQVFADRHGNVVHMGERDCSVQRRHQKVIEEAPSPAVTPALRAQMGAVAIAATLAIGYCGAGTLEFLLDADGHFYFMEMNTRLQVEHAVTESLLGIDLVEWQLRVAQGERLPLDQAEIDRRYASGGHAIEVRLCAEDPAQDFLPQSGQIDFWQAPPGVRCEHALHSGGQVSPHYDSMLAKIIAHGTTREDARRKLMRALTQCHLLGVASNRYFLGQCLAHPVFAAGGATTGFIAEHLDAAARTLPPASAATRLLACALLSWQRREQQQQRYPAELIGWASSQAYPQICRFELDGEAQQCTSVMLGAANGEIIDHGERIAFAISDINSTPAAPRAARELSVLVNGSAQRVLLTANHFVLQGREHRLHDTTALPAARAAQAGGDGRISAPMNGRVVSLMVAKGDAVKVGQVLLVLEAMKMEHAILARTDGVVEEVLVQVGAQVAPGQVMVVMGAVQPA
jgi:geranyl-CoA carboxylase alpha subunit